MDHCLQAFDGKRRRLQTFGGIRGSSLTSFSLQMESLRSFCWLTWIVFYKPFVANGVVYKPLVHTWIAVYKPSVAQVDRRSKAFDGRWSRLQAFGALHGSPFKSLWWQMESFTSLWCIHGSPSTSLRWLRWIAAQKPLMANGVVYKPLVACEDRRLQAFGG